MVSASPGGPRHEASAFRGVRALAAPADPSLDACPALDTAELPAGPVGAGGDVGYVVVLVVEVLNTNLNRPVANHPF